MKIKSLPAMLFLIASPAFAQATSAVLPVACGSKDVSFDVKLDDSHRTLAQPEPGKALIYCIQETGAGNCAGPCVTRSGLDGAWMGAFNHNSYFSASVDPGEHPVCMNLQPASPSGNLRAFAQVTAEAGKVY